VEAAKFYVDSIPPEEKVSMSDLEEDVKIVRAY
jgi:hypothetical protein